MPGSEGLGREVGSSPQRLSSPRPRRKGEAASAVREREVTRSGGPAGDGSGEHPSEHPSRGPEGADDQPGARAAHGEADAAEVVRLRLFAGLSVAEAAAALGLARATAYRHWTYARAWLRDALLDGGAAAAE